MKKSYFWIAGFVFAADRVTKILAPQIPAGGSVLIPGVVGLQYVQIEPHHAYESTCLAQLCPPIGSVIALY